MKHLFMNFFIVIFITNMSCSQTSNLSLDTKAIALIDKIGEGDTLEIKSIFFIERAQATEYIYVYKKEFSYFAIIKLAEINFNSNIQDTVITLNEMQINKLRLLEKDQSLLDENIIGFSGFAVTYELSLGSNKVVLNSKKRYSAALDILL